MQAIALLFSTVLAAASMATADPLPVKTLGADLAAANLLVHFGTKTEAPLPTAAAVRRANDDLKQQTCELSVLGELMPPPPDNSQLNNWAAERTLSNECTITVPESISSAYTSYASVVTHWYETVGDKAAKQTDCGDKSFSVNVEAVCTASRTVFFTDSDKKTAASSVYAPLNIPSDGVILIGAAPRNTGMVGVSIALAGVVITILSL